MKIMVSIDNSTDFDVIHFNRAWSSLSSQQCVFSARLLLALRSPSLTQSQQRASQLQAGLCSPGRAGELPRFPREPCSGEKLLLSRGSHSRPMHLGGVSAVCRLRENKYSRSQKE